MGVGAFACRGVTRRSCGKLNKPRPSLWLLTGMQLTPYQSPNQVSEDSEEGLSAFRRGAVCTFVVISVPPVLIHSVTMTPDFVVAPKPTRACGLWIQVGVVIRNISSLDNHSFSCLRFPYILLSIEMVSTCSSGFEISRLNFAWNCEFQLSS